MAEGGLSLNRSQESIDERSGDHDSTVQSSHVLQRIKSDRIPVTKPEEDRRRRTIIVEKKNGSFGFTLQSYGIHYKKEQEVEMITYVDFVEYDGPAYKSGMREGDVILSINGTDMEKADHKTIVTYIKNCDSRMRMVVLFEDCVRKVELHMRYIQLQNVLHSKMNELERTCLKERELLEGKKIWKTHSLPAPRKKASSAAAAAAASNVSPSTEYLTPSMSDLENINTTAFPNVRPISEDDLTKANKHSPSVIAPPVQFMLATYQYLDPQCRYILKPSASNSGEYLLSIGPPARSKSEHQQFYNANSISHDELSASQENVENNHDNQKDTRCNSKPRNHCHKRSCNPCLGSQRDKQNNGDNVSLDAYDLASPCCNPECVPRRSKHKEHKHKHRDKDRAQRPRSQSHVCHKKQAAQQTAQCNHIEKHNHRRLHNLSNQLASRCSLHSCISSSDFDGGGGVAESSATSYTTSLSTDTLYWDQQSDASATNSRQQSIKSRQSYNSLQHPSAMLGNANVMPQHRHHHHHHQKRGYHIAPTQGGAPQPIPNHENISYYDTQYIQQKPKSWDNLAMKAIGGYGFGYGYLEKANTKARTNVTSSGTVRTHFLESENQIMYSSQGLTTNRNINEIVNPNHQHNSVPRKNPSGRYSLLNIENYAPPPSQFVQEFAATTTTTSFTKSTDNLLDTYNNVSNTSINSCECKPVDSQNKILKHKQQSECIGYYSNLPKTTVCKTMPLATTKVKSNDTTAKNCETVSTVSEITRL
ncbi:uncharacterized protein LOC116352663 isoform X2 [Contarinia nasturtii]|uniref:uncharacterized protein LOC116352663 isoform X2 n=1 Tax=Contarinia nasturtii TaxID=265458 RepID=UPI0012D40230|nr:uncharacterized protein LOC116352663 isoform X2 [Contarinia nasturtii]